MHEYPAQVERVIDGDTIEMLVDLGFHVHARVEFRLLGINSPEMKGKTRQAGQAAKDHLTFLFTTGKCVVKSVKPSKTDKYGRWLASISVEQPDGTTFDVAARMTTDGHAVPYTP